MVCCRRRSFQNQQNDRPCSPVTILGFRKVSNIRVTLRSTDSTRRTHPVSRSLTKVSSCAKMALASSRNFTKFHNPFRRALTRNAKHTSLPTGSSSSTVLQLLSVWSFTGARSRSPRQLIEIHDTDLGICRDGRQMRWTFACGIDKKVGTMTRRKLLIKLSIDLDNKMTVFAVWIKFTSAT